jgi:hypothetical protein
MTATAVLREFEARGVRLELELDGRVFVSAPKGALQPSDLERLRSEKPAITELLRQKSTTTASTGIDQRIPPEVVAEIRRIEAEASRLGWSHERLWNADFWPHTKARPRGLASILNPGDYVAEVSTDFLLIVQQGKPLRFFRCDS